MTSFETVVRPAVLPNIRPTPTASVPIADAPDKGLAVITGGGNSVVDLSHSETHSWSKSRHVEVKRTFDKARVYYTSPDGTIDYSQYWEFEVLRSIEFIENGATTTSFQYAPFQNLDNVEIVEEGLTRAVEQ